MLFQVRFRLQVQFVDCVPVPKAGQVFRESTVFSPSVRHPVASLEPLKSVPSFLVLIGILFLSELHVFLLPAFIATFRRQSGWDVITSSSPAVVPNQTCTSKSAVAHFPLERCRWKKASQPLLILDLETPEQDSQRAVLLTLRSTTPLVERPFHRSHLGPSENTHACVTVHHSGKVTVMK